MNVKVQIVTFLLIYVVVKAIPLLLRWKITILIKDHHPIASKKASATIAAVVLIAISIIGGLNNIIFSCYSIHSLSLTYMYVVCYFFLPFSTSLFIFSFSFKHFSFFYKLFILAISWVRKKMFSCCCSLFFCAILLYIALRR